MKLQAMTSHCTSGQQRFLRRATIVAMSGVALQICCLPQACNQAPTTLPASRVHSVIPVSTLHACERQDMQGAASTA